MLFPLMIGVAIGISLERHYLSDKKEECKDKQKRKEKDEKKDDSKEND